MSIYIQVFVVGSENARILKQSAQWSLKSSTVVDFRTNRTRMKIKVSLINSRIALNLTRFLHHKNFSSELGRAFLWLSLNMNWTQVGDASHATFRSLIAVPKVVRRVVIRQTRMNYFETAKFYAHDDSYSRISTK